MVIKKILSTIAVNYVNHPKFKSRVGQRLEIMVDFTDNLYDILIDMINKFLKAIGDLIKIENFSAPKMIH